MAITNFKTKARVVDLLGRQQIGDTPTAMGELMKNSLDAGARNFWAHLHEEEHLLTLRDDGIGMREEDVLTKWLVIATDSKTTADKNSERLKYADDFQKHWCTKEQYGEKGIGRLSISTLGRGVLLWTVWGKGEEQEGTMCAVNWDMFQCPSLLFEEIPVTYKKFKAKPTRDELRDFLKTTFKTLTTKTQQLENKIPSNIKSSIVETNEKILELSHRNLEMPWEVGTYFYIVSLTEDIGDLFQEKCDTQETRRITPDALKAFFTFSSFWNPFVKDGERNFQIHPLKNGKKLERADDFFWCPDDLTNCDHHISIDIDEQGYAKGTLQNYGKKAITYERQLSYLDGVFQSPGPIHVEIGYVQGSPEISPLPKQLHLNMSKRLEIAGGFSVYLNNVRVQPYGLVDNDFMGFEARRSLNAGRYYFSHRRMFGGVFIPTKSGTGLREKAGREGFINNASFRGLKRLLYDLFIDLADSYYGSRSNRKDKEKKKLNNDKTPSKAHLQARKIAFIKKLKASINNFENLKTDTKNAVIHARDCLSLALDSSQASIIKDCKLALQRLHELYNYIIALPNSTPGGVRLDREQSEAFQNFLTNKNELLLNLERELGALSAKEQIIVSKFEEKEALIKSLCSSLDQLWNNIQKDLNERCESILDQINKLNDEIAIFIRKCITECREKFELTVEGNTAEDVVEDTTGGKRKVWERAIQSAKRHYSESIIPRVDLLLEDLSNVTKESSSSFLLTDLSRKLEKSEEEKDFLIEMAQIGLILETSDHEYKGNINDISLILSELLRVVPKHSKSLVQELSKSFSIVEERLSLFDPFIAKRNTSLQSINGEEISAFLKERLHNSLDNIELKFSTSFLEQSWPNVKKAIFFGSIYNLVLNAMYWVKRSSEKPCILLSVSGDSLVVSDSGPGIAEVDIDRIFLPGFSRKKFGRGLGLYIAKEALSRIHYSLELSNSPEIGALHGANFTISPDQTINNNKESNNEY